MRFLICLILLLIGNSWVSAQTRDEMLTHNNAIRAQHGKIAQQLDPRLCAAAQEQANHCAKYNVLGHFINGDPRSRAGKYGFVGRVEEILAGDFKRMENAFQGWLSSAGHRQCVLGDTTHCGLAVATNKDTGANVWCVVYGTEGASEPPASPVVLSSGGQSSQACHVAASAPRGAPIRGAAVRAGQRVGQAARAVGKRLRHPFGGRLRGC